MMPGEWDEWRSHPVTQEFFRYLKKLREEVKEEWANSTYVGAYDGETIQRNAAAIGQVNLLQALIETRQEDLEDSE